MAAGRTDSTWLTRQVAYYRARAAEYDTGYETRMPMPVLRAAVEALPVRGDVLEIACGTGQWTPMLAARSRSVMAVDAAPEMLDRARRRLLGSDVHFDRVDVFDWQPARRYDTVFFAFWLTHVPLDRWPTFWGAMRNALRPGGQAVFLDDSSVKEQIEESAEGAEAPVVRRRLADGSEHYAVKVFHTPKSLSSRLAALDWSGSVSMVDDFHLSGTVAPQDAA